MSLILLNMDSNSDPTIIENSKDRVEKIDRTAPELSVELVLNEGHAVSPRKIEVCNRGRFAVTEAERPGEKIKLWDLKSAKLLQNFTGYDFALSNDILYINKVAKNSAAIFTKDPVEVWDLKSLTQLPAPKWRHRVVKLSSDGSFALSYDLLLENQPVKESIIFDTDSGKKVVRLFGELIAISKDFTYALINRNGLTFLVKVFENLYL
ncbi:MAG: hypothetical protein JNN15_09875, partial [Blastocatellia bacterium]|nr:hypothetical protein [Blastocatellia bacterium]